MRVDSKPLLFALLCVSWLGYEIIQSRFVSWLIDEGYIHINYASTSLSTLQVLILTIIVYPFLEEIIFRLPLRLNVPNVALSLITSIWYYIFSFDTETQSGITILILTTATVVILVFWFKGKKLRRVLALLNGKKWFSWFLVIFSASIFTLVHLWRIDFGSLIHSLTFLLTSYFIFGLFLSYARIKFDFWASLFFHVLHNSVPYLILIYYSILKGENLFKYI